MTVSNKISTFFFTHSATSKDAIQKFQIEQEPPMSGKVYLFVSFFNLNFDSELSVKCTIHTPDKVYAQNEPLSLNGFIENDQTMHLNMSLIFDTPGDISATLTLFSLDGDKHREVDNATTYVKYIGKEGLEHAGTD
ncbi:hypothetical protein [Lacticaseibacillus suibinensis]|uniref:hypothetical protein n=1 Tax=Lacticaseibacillus suibinensis TaxID=2486011 RepID=UPI000F7A9890|nr:hypothetical protein [Lacticaseibacillus suibinensis]